jgi:transcription elongation factor Elf1
MSHIVLNKWNELRAEIERNKENIDAELLIKLLLNWAGGIKEINDIQIKKIYTQYLEYFEDVDIESVLFDKEGVWYSLEEIINVDLLGFSPRSYERPIVKVRDILWELLVFKSNSECSCCNDDNFRVMIDKKKTELFFTCDRCGCIQDIMGNKKDIQEKLYPATTDLIRKHRIVPS